MSTSTKRSGILAGGNWIVDQLKRIDTYPQQDALANILEESIGNGGSPFNLLVNLARLGAPFPLSGVGLVGEDDAGRWIQETCRLHGIDTRALHTTPEAPTSYTDVMTVATTGRRTFFHQRGTNALLDVEAFDFTSSRAKLFHLGYLLLLDRLDQPDAEFGTRAGRVLHGASEAGLATSIDVVSEDGDRFPSVVLPTLKQVDYAILNEFELERTAGLRVRTPDGINPEALALASTRLLEAGVRRWVVVHFPEGATALGPDGQLHQQGSVRVGTIRSSVGAGDAFAAGLLYELHENAPISAALEAGVCAAAACLAGDGASDGVRPLSECLHEGHSAGFKALF